MRHSQNLSSPEFAMKHTEQILYNPRQRLALSSLIKC